MKKYVAIDIETYFSSSYSLSAYCTWQYILSPLFRILFATASTWQEDAQGNVHHLEEHVFTTRHLKVDEVIPFEDVSGIFHDQLKIFLEDIGYAEADVVFAHNAAFDFPALRHATGLMPKCMCCTMLIAQYRWGSADSGGRYTSLLGGKNALGHVHQRIKGGDPTQLYAGKDSSALLNLKGVSDLYPETVSEQYYKNYVDYGVEDTVKCYDIARATYKHIPKSRKYAIHWSLQQITDPVLSFDYPMARQYYEAQIQLAKTTARSLAGGDESVFRSAAKFKALMETIIGPGNWPEVVSDKGNVNPLMSANDPKWEEILGDPNTPDAVIDLMEAKVELGRISRDKRIFRYCEIAELLDGLLPMHLIPSGAHTHRLTGGSGAGGNNLNMPQGGVVRQALGAPPGSCLVVFDYSSFELRISRSSARDISGLDVILSGGDLYVKTASGALGIPEDQIDKKQRHIGKITELSCQYGTGAKTLALSTRIPIEQAQLFVDQFRKVDHVPVKEAWDACSLLLWYWSNYTQEQWNEVDQETWHKTFGLNMPCRYEYRKIVWPSGTTLYYDNLHQFTDKWEDGSPKTSYAYRPRHARGMSKFIYGALLFENMVQSLANEIMWERQQMIEQRLGIRVALQVYDEIVMVVADELAPTVYWQIKQIMELPIGWWLDAPPLEAEGEIVRRYSEAK